MSRLPLILLQHQWRSAVRSVFRPQQLAGTIILSVMVVVLALNLLSLGLFLERILARLDPSVDPVAMVNGVLVYYVVLDLLLRLWFQKIPGQIVRPYLALPVRRTTLVHYLLTKSLLSLFNVLPLLLFVPVALRVIGPARGPTASAGWLVFLILLLLTNSTATLYVRKRELVNPWWSVGVLGVASAVGLLDAAGLFSLRELSGGLFEIVLRQPVWCLVPLAAFGTLYWKSFTLLRHHLTLEDLPMAGSSVPGGRRTFRGIENLGSTGRMIALELKMLLRNKRPRAVVIFAAAMIPVLIGFEAYWLTTMPERNEIYPVPDSLALARHSERSHDALGTMRKVTFVVRASNMPEGTWVHLTGNLAALGQWNPAAVPLIPQGEGIWRQTLVVPDDTLLEWRITLGSWDAQRLLADGSRPHNMVLHVSRDTTVTAIAERWRFPEVFVLVDVNLIYIGILLSGMFLITYGQLLLGWDGSYLEGIVARPVDFSHYIAAKYAILTAGVLGSFCLTLPLGLLKPWFIPASASLALYNAGVNAFVLLSMARFSRRPVDLNASLFSMQAKGTIQLLLIAPVLLGPLVVYVGCAVAGESAWTFWILGGLGVMGLAFYRLLLRRIAGMILRGKHRIIAAYRLA